MSGGFKVQPKGFATKAIHVGQEPEQWKCRSVIPQLCMSTTFQQDGPGDFRGYEYSRIGNPTRNVLERCMASLDNAKYGLAFASGLGATTAILSMLSHGDHIVVGDDIYVGSDRLIRQFASRLGIEASFVDPRNLKEFKAAFKSNTKLVWVESPTNPLLQVADIQALCEITHSFGDVVLAIDNSYLTSYFQRPLELGADIVCYSLSKFMNGHSDVVMGGVTTNSDDLYKRLKFFQKDMGIVPSPFDCYQVNRSLKTLAVRMEQHHKNSLAVAIFLENHPRVQKVLHPALPSHPQHELSLKQTYGHSGVFAFYLEGNLENSKAFFKALKVFTLAESLGGFESLAGLPAFMTHALVPRDDRKNVGISETLIRISVGLEDVDDLIADLDSALSASQKI